MLMKEWIKSNRINQIKDLLCNVRNGAYDARTHTHIRALAHALVNLYNLISILILRGTYLALFRGM